MPAKKTSRESIILQALQVFRRQGYHHTSIKDLSEACGIQKAHFYYYFKNKEGIMDEILRTVNAYFEHKVLAYAYDDDLIPQDRIEKICSKLYRALRNEQGGCIMANTALEVARLDKSPVFLAQTKVFFQQFTDALTYILQDVYTPTQAVHLAERTIQDIEGGLILMQVYQDERYFLNALHRTQTILSQNSVV